jgi:hypothetical protein
MSVSKERKQFLHDIEKLLEKHKEHLSGPDIAYDLIVTGGLMTFHHAPTIDEGHKFLANCIHDIYQGFIKMQEREDGKDK